MRYFAALALVVWTGTFHHDVWMDVLDLDHHHDHHAAADHQNAHHHGPDGNTHSDDSEHDHRDTIPLPDTNTDVVASTVAKIGVDGPKLVPESDLCLLLAIAHFLTGPSAAEIGQPPPQDHSDHNPSALILLAHSVQSNAPPSLS